MAAPTLWLGLLFLFYTVESLERERTTGFAPLFYATPVPTGAVVAGKVAGQRRGAGGRAGGEPARCRP